jgi:spore coat protein U-like protein
MTSRRTGSLSAIDHIRAALFVLAAILCWSAPAAAQVACQPDGLTIDFGTVNVLSGQTAYASGSLTVICYNESTTAPATITACLSSGSGSGGGTATSRLLSSGASTLPVELRNTPAVPPPPAQIGNGISNPLAGPVFLTAAPSSFAFASIPISADIPPQSTLPPPGTYSSTFSGSQFELYGTTAAVGGNCTQVVNQATTSYGGTLTVNATIPDQCTVAATPMNYGTASLLTAPLTATASVTLTCNASTSVTVALDNGATGTGPTTRLMTSGGNTVGYGIYQDSARALPWGSSPGVNTQAASVTGTSSLTLTAYGQVPAQPSAAPGDYTDVINVTVSY